MKSNTKPKPALATRSFCVLVMLILVLAGCGYKGDLVLADPAAEGAAAKTGDEDADAKPSAQED